MKAIVIGCGRVGSSIAKQLLEEGWDVTAIDERDLVVGQVVQKRFGVECVVVRVLDPARAKFYNERGLTTISPTSTAIDALTDSVRACAVRVGQEVPT